MLYCTGEHICNMDHDHEQCIIQATDFFSVCVHSQCYTFVKEKIFSHPLDEPTHRYSSNPFGTPTSQIQVFPAAHILRKVMLYPDPENIDVLNRYVVIDFQRPDLPLSPQDIIIPVYPLKGDMVRVNGDSGDIWQAHVLAVDDRARTCKVHFYVEDTSRHGTYVRESFGRVAVETIHWDSILELLTGYWEGASWKLAPSLN